MCGEQKHKTKQQQQQITNTSRRNKKSEAEKIQKTNESRCFFSAASVALYRLIKVPETRCRSELKVTVHPKVRTTGFLLCYLSTQIV